MTVIFDEWLEINGVDLATHAYWVESLAPLFTLQKRGSDRTVPTAAGSIPYRRVTTAVSVSLTINVFGDVDADGNASVDARAGLYEHLRLLEDNLLADVETTAGTLTAVWHQPDLDREAEVHVEGFTVRGINEFAAECTLEVTIPAGLWTDAEGSS